MALQFIAHSTQEVGRQNPAAPTDGSSVTVSALFVMAPRVDGHAGRMEPVANAYTILVFKEGEHF
jgi:hypothetical protein